MKYIVSFFLIIFSLFANSQTTLNFTKIPYSNNEIRDIGRGGEDWQYREQFIVNIPTDAARQDPKNLYKRYKWFELESTQGVYDFSVIETDIRYCIERKMKLGVGIMHQYVGDQQGGYPTADGAGLTYPLYLHTLMQALPANERDWITYESAAWWTPNYNASIYLDRFDSLHANFNRWLNNTTYQGVKYKNVIQYIDVRGYGNWGEWNQVDVLSDAANGWPTGRKATYATLKRIIDSYTTYFPDVYLAIMIAAFDCERLGNVWNPPAIARYAIDTAQNQKGKLSWRRDNFGSLDGYVNFWLEDNTATSIRDTTINYFIMNRWRTNPIINEHTSVGQEATTTGFQYSTLEDQVIQYNVSSFGIGNDYEPDIPHGETVKNYFRAASKRAGHRYVLNSGSMTTTLSSGGSFNITLGWGNEGVAPTYDGWDVIYELRNSTTNAVVWRDTSDFMPKTLLPGTRTVNENFTLSTVPAGTYRMHLIVKDSVNYVNPMQVMINGRQSDGSYIIRSNITVTSTGNQPPISNAGVDQSITLPTNEVFVIGSGTDSDGTISSYAWTKVSGPSVFNIVQPNANSTYINSLVAGTYVFRLTVTDNLGATAFDDVTIVVNATAPANQPPVSNAGANQTIQLPTNSVTAVGSGTDSDGTIASYAWTKISGTGGTITSPSSSSTTITGLSQGTYVYRLTVTDDDGATAFDDLQVIVTAANVSPTANAGSDQTIELPTNTVTLTGSGTDSDGTIAGYLWTKVSGPAGGAISSPTAQNTDITGLLQGTYVYRLRVTDNQGATGTDEVTITVDPAPPPSQPGNWVFSTNPTPALGSDGQGISLGMKFRSSQAGAITQVRFWKTAGNTGTHTAAIYELDGTRLWKGTFTNETGSGWQYVNTDTVFISANTTYIVAYYTPTGNYAKTEGSFYNSIINNMLTAPSTYTSNGNGVYLYSDSVSFPTNTYQGNNYWVDVNYQNIEAPVTPNVGPVVSAGLDQIIKLPTTSYQLNGTATDSDGTIAGVDWAQLSGPSTATISDTTILNPVLTGLNTIGTYQFLLTVTDDDGATATDLIAIRVFGASSNYRIPRVYIYNGRKIFFRR